MPKQRALYTFTDVGHGARARYPPPKFGLSENFLLVGEIFFTTIKIRAKIPQSGGLRAKLKL